jgi:hypothetical protein
MKFALALNTNLTTEQNSWINNLSRRLEKYFSDKSYSKGLKELYIGLICVKPEFDQFFQPRKLKYQKGKINKVINGTEITVEDCIEYELKIDYEELRKLDETSITEKITDALINSIYCVGILKELMDFDYSTFREDLQKFVGRKEVP